MTSEWGRQDADLSLVIPEFATANIRDRGTPVLSTARGLPDPGSPLRGACPRAGQRPVPWGRDDDREKVADIHSVVIAGLVPLLSG